MRTVVSVILLILFGCKFNVNKDDKTQVALISNQTNCSKTIMIDTLNEHLIPLNYKEFDTTLIKKEFKKPFVFKVTRTYPNDDSFICNFKSDVSEIIFSAKGYKQDFYLDYAKITDNSIRFNYKIEIGMSKEQFFLNIKQPFVQCDSIKIAEIGCESLFVFKDEKLKEVVLTTSI